MKTLPRTNHWLRLLHVKGALALFTAISLAADAPQGTEITRAEATSIKAVDPEDLGDQLLAYDGKLVKIKFNYRGSNIEKKDDGALKGRISLWRSSFDLRQGNKGSKYGHVDVVVPPAGADWFMKLPTSDQSRATIHIIARVSKGDFYPKAELLGREIKTDARGSRVVW